MKLSLSTFAYIRYPLGVALRKTAKFGYDATEIVANRPHMLPEDYPWRERKKIRTLADSLHLDIPVVTSFNGTPQWHFAHPRAEVRRATTKHVKESVDLAVDLGAFVVEVVSGIPRLERVSSERAWELMVEQIGECAEYAEEHNVVIGLEPEPGNVVSTTGHALRMVDEVDSRGLGLLLDVGHLNVVEENIPNSILSASKHLVHVHVNDNDGTGDQHLPPGDGTIDFQAILAALRRIGYDRYLTVELEQSDGDSSVIRSKKFMEELLL